MSVSRRGAAAGCSGRPTRGRVLGLAFLLFSASGCVPASPGPQTFEDKAALTVGAAVSEVATAELSLHELNRGRTFAPTVLTALRYSEDSLGTATTAFTELNPPITDDRLYDRVSSVLGDAADLLAQTRIAVNRGDVSQYAGLVEQLRALGKRLEALEKQVAS
jgi:hypothetical protein